MKQYDIAIIGGGISGSLLFLELRKLLPHASIAIIEPNPKSINDRVISFWSKAAFPLEGIPHLTWDTLSIIDSAYVHQFSIAPYKYYSFESIYLYEKVRTIVSETEHLTIYREHVKEVRDLGNNVLLMLSSQSIYAYKVFDSHRNLTSITEECSKDIFLYQEFSGVKIQTTKSTFSEIPYIFDLRLHKSEAFTFFYCIPYSDKQALIDCVSYTKTIRGTTPKTLKEYIEQTLHIENYQVIFREGGIIPLTTHRFRRERSANVYSIGTNGGRIKPSTGYGFTRMLADAQFIAHSLSIGNTILFQNPNTFYRLCDSVFLKIVQNEPEEMPAIFKSMFKRDNSSHVLSFLDESASLSEISKIAKDLPKHAFLKEIL